MQSIFLQSFIPNFNKSSVDLSISVTVDTVYCNSNAIIDLPIFGLVSCTPIILLPIIGVQLTRTTG